MSYKAAAALQAAIHDHLTGASALSGVAIHDELPSSPSSTFVLIGAEEVNDASDVTGAGAEHRLVISVISDGAGFAAAKTLAGTISDELSDAALTLTTGRLVALRFERAVARRRDDGAQRRIDLTFRARLEM